MIPQIEPWIDSEEEKLIVEVIRSTQITEGPFTLKFENLTRELTESNYAIAYSNGTNALYACLINFGIGNGDEVIVPNLTFIATATSVIQTGAKPVFCDIDPVSLCMSPENIEGLITERTKAIIPVHLYGNAVDMDAILEIAIRYNLIILEDAAQGVGVKYKGKHVGSIGHAGILSYYGNKTITCGEGGIILTNSSEFRDKVYSFKNHGRPKKGTFVHDKIGYNFAFTEMQAAIGVAQMGKLSRIIHAKNKIYENYRSAFPSIKFLERAKNTSNFVPWFTTIFVENPRDLQDYLLKNGVGTRLLFPPLDSQPCFRDLELSNEFFPNTYSAYTHGISLPSSVTLTERQLSKVTNLVNEFYA